MTQPDPAAPSHFTTPRWRLRLLGAVDLRDSAGRPLRLPTRAATLMLARLALAPQRQHPREELVDLLWPGVDLDTGRNRLRQALSVLRTLLESPQQDPSGALPALMADRRAVWLAPGALLSDVSTFVQALAQGRFDVALACYQGELLPGHFDNWVLEERGHLAARAEALAARAQGAPLSRAPLASEPLPPLARLPRYLTRLIGFDADRSTLTSLVRTQRLVVLRGPGGAGKTRLAVEVARALAKGEDEVAPAFNLVSFVPLAACTQREQMLDALLHALRQDVGADTADAAQRVAGALAGRRVLLVLDNFEQLVEAGRDEVARWLADLPLLHLLITSRRSLELDGETEHALAALPLPLPSHLPDVQAGLLDQALNPSVALFVDRARAVRSDFQLTPGNQVLVTDIVRALHGLPLAIELAAARVRSLGLAEMRDMLGPAAGLSPSLTWLSRSGPRAPDDARHASMLQVLRWSWQQLSAGEQALLAALAACDDGASLRLVAALLSLTDAAGAPAPSRGDAALRADALVAASVVYPRTDAHGSHRYQVFEPMREFVFLQAGPGGLAKLRAAHAQAMAQWAAALAPQDAMAAARADWGNVMRALASAADEALPGANPAQAIDMLWAIRPVLDDLLLLPSALDHLRQVVVRAPGHHTAAMQGLLAMHSYEAGQREAAACHAAAAVDGAALALAAADGVERAHAQRCAARVKMRLGQDSEQVLQLADEAVAMARRYQQTDTLAWSLTTRAVLCLRRDHDLQANVRAHEEVLALWRDHGLPERVASGLAGLALALGFLRRVPEQLVLLEEARGLAARQGQHRLLAFTHSITGYALADQRRFAESASHYRQCLELSWETASWREWFYALWNLPRTLAHLRRPEPAARLMGFAQAFYASRFGTLGKEDLPEARRTRRLVAAQAGRLQALQWWAQGAQMDMASAMAMARAEP
ncbi:MAG: NACHT domain-containing protein [Rubrivivax sp.]|nr:NACHT domain-containing protein [Rubrivivax sp.]